MAINTAIEWTESTWNPVTGCTKISIGCKNCYAERFAYRLQKMGNSSYRNGFKLTIHDHLLNRPLIWKRPQMIFVNSMSDLFHKNVSEEFILRVFSVMENANWHVFQVLTKRSERLAQLNGKIKWPSNVWMGVSVETSDYKYRIDHLKKIQARVRFLSLEPLLGPITNLNLDGIDWVIVGGESGPKARIMKREWVTEIRDQCISKRIPFFFKQWGGINKKKSGRLLDGRIWSELPQFFNLPNRKKQLALAFQSPNPFFKTSPSHQDSHSTPK
jgi:protein gp37